MRPLTSPAGPAGLTVLAAAAVAGIILAVHGWSTRHSGLTPGAIGAGTSSAAAAGPSAPARATSPAAHGARRVTSPAPSGSPTASSPGPKLSTQSYAHYSFRVWPGTPSAAAKAALTGLSVRVRRVGSGISVTAGTSGQPAAAPRFYANGTRVYIVEASMGDDSNNSDYSLGDDGLVVTDAQGRILR
jgi:hypothetical protein